MECPVPSGSIHEYDVQVPFRFQEAFSILIRKKSVLPNSNTRHSKNNTIMILKKQEKLARLLKFNNDVRTCL